MTVDDTELTNILQLANDKLVTCNLERTKLKKFIRTCENIVKEPIENNSNIMRDIIDNSLGTTMTDTRRQAIYDKLVKEKVTLELG